MEDMRGRMIIPPRLKTLSTAALDAGTLIALRYIACWRCSYIDARMENTLHYLAPPYQDISWFSGSV